MNHPWYRRRSLLVTRPHADHDTNNVNENISHYSHGNDISLDIFEEMVAMTMEACIVNKNPELVLEVLAFSEDYGLAKPTKRMYLALLQTFGLLNDIVQINELIFFYINLYLVHYLI